MFDNVQRILSTVEYALFQSDDPIVMAKYLQDKTGDILVRGEAGMELIDAETELANLLANEPIIDRRFMEQIADALAKANLLANENKAMKEGLDILAEIMEVSP